MGEHIQKDNIGTRFTSTIVEDGAAKNVSSATTKKILFRKADKTTFIKDATFVTDGTDGKIYYDSEAGDLDVPGAGWEYQGYVVLVTPRAGTYYSEKKGFIVGDNIDTVT